MTRLERCHIFLSHSYVLTEFSENSTKHMKEPTQRRDNRTIALESNLRRLEGSADSEQEHEALNMVTTDDSEDESILDNDENSLSPVETVGFETVRMTGNRTWSPVCMVLQDLLTRPFL